MTHRPAYIKDEHLDFISLLVSRGCEAHSTAPTLNFAFSDLSVNKAKEAVMYWIETNRGNKS